ncbi:MAG: peptidoglycan D,D-transpeptidase FtsI family protein [Chloroflexota bacterium]
MHANMRRTLNLILIFFALIAFWLGYWGIARRPELLARTDNPRRVVAEQQIQRGPIVDRHGAPLVWSERNDDGILERRYAGDWLAHAVGYYSLRHGVGGAEAAFDDELRGVAGRTAWQAWRDDLLHLPQVGEQVQLALDADLQRAASEALGKASGAVVLLDTQNGQVLALVSRPTFDTNTLDEDWDSLREAAGNPLFNRATQGLYPPGATFNLVVMAAALEERLTTADEVFTDRVGRQQFGEATVRCANHPGLIDLSLLQAAAYGCNVAFAELSLRLGGERLARYADWFGIGLAPGIEIPAQAGQLKGDEPWSDELLALTGMGQGGVLVSPLQMALIAATIANDGAMPWPGLRSGSTVPPRPVIQPQTAQLVRQAMVLAVTHGPAHLAALPEVTVAGKVGTAEAGEEVAPHGWFVGFAPAGAGDGPRYAVAVIVEHGGSGGQSAAPIAAEMLERALSGQ